MELEPVTGRLSPFTGLIHWFNSGSICSNVLTVIKFYKPVKLIMYVHYLMLKSTIRKYMIWQSISNCSPKALILSLGRCKGVKLFRLDRIINLIPFFDFDFGSSPFSSLPIHWTSGLIGSELNRLNWLVQFVLITIVTCFGRW